MGKHDRHRHQLGGFVTGKTEHQTLITGTLLLEQPFPFGHSLGNIGGLLIDGGQYRTGFIIKTHGRVGVANLLDGLPHDGRQIGIGGGGDLAGNDRHASGHHGFTGDPGFGILSKNRIENSIGNLVSHLVRVPFTYRF